MQDVEEDQRKTMKRLVKEQPKEAGSGSATENVICGRVLMNILVCFSEEKLIQIRASLSVWSRLNE